MDCSCFCSLPAAAPSEDAKRYGCLPCPISSTTFSGALTPGDITASIIIIRKSSCVVNGTKWKTGALHLPPLHAVRGVFEDDITGFELVADFVGGGPVLVLSGLVALFDQGFDFGVEGIGLLLVEEAEDAGELVVKAERVLAQRAGRRGGGGQRGVDLAGEVKQGGEGVGGVEVVVHRLDEFVAAGGKAVADGGFLVLRLSLGVREEELEVFAAGVEAVEGRAALVQDVHAVIDGAAVVGRDHQVPDGLVAELVGDVADGEEIAEALAHLAVVDVDIAVVHPVMREGDAAAALALGDLVLVMREDEILPAAVDVDRLAEAAARHGGALNVPAGTPLSPRRRPARLAGLRALPQGEVHGVLLELAGGDARAGLELLERLVGELAVLLVHAGAEVDVAVPRRVGAALLDKRLDDGQNFRDVLRRARMYRRGPDVQPGGVRLVLGDILLGHGHVVRALLVRAADDLVVDVREILHERHLHPAVLEVPPQDVKDADGSRVPDVDEVVDRRAAGVDFRFVRGDGGEGFFLAGEGVVDLHEDGSFRGYILNIK